MIPVRLNWHRRLPGNYHAQGSVLWVTDDFGNMVKAPWPRDRLQLPRRELPLKASAHTTLPPRGKDTPIKKD